MSSLIEERQKSFADYTAAMSALRSDDAISEAAELVQNHLKHLNQVSSWQFFEPPPFGHSTGFGVGAFELSLPTQAQPRSYEPKTTRPISAVSADTAQESAITSNWWRLHISKVPEKVFNDIFSAAVSSKRVTGPYAPLSTKSLDMFLELWGAVQAFASEPVVSVSPKGDVVAEWFRDPDHCLTILATGDEFFYSLFEIFYSLFENGSPNEGRLPNVGLGNFVNDMRARELQPFSWSDA